MADKAQIQSLPLHARDCTFSMRSEFAQDKSGPQDKREEDEAMPGHSMVVAVGSQGTGCADLSRPCSQRILQLWA
jgi:hypothetical protein